MPRTTGRPAAECCRLLFDYVDADKMVSSARPWTGGAGSGVRAASQGAKRTLTPMQSFALMLIVLHHGVSYATVLFFNVSPATVSCHHMTMLSTAGVVLSAHQPWPTATRAAEAVPTICAPR